jgi:hypothetical protein
VPPVRSLARHAVAHGYAPATVPGISVPSPDLVKRLREDPGSVDLTKYEFDQT